MARYYGFFPVFANWNNMSYLGPDARSSFATYQSMYSSLSSARNYDVRANPNLFNEAVGLLNLSNSSISVPSGYPSAIEQSVKDLFRARDAMYEHFRKDRDLGLKDIQLRKEAQEREAKLRAERARLRQEEEARFEAQRKVEEERRQKEKRFREELATKRFYELKGAIEGTDRRLTANINRLRADFVEGMKKQGDLFSELSSVREKDNADTIAQFNEALMESSNVNISLQSDVNKLNKETDSQKIELKALRENFNNLSNLYNVSEKKLKLNESNLLQLSLDKGKTEKDVQNLSVRLDNQNKESGTQFAKLNQTMKEGQARFEGTIGELREELKRNIGEVNKRQGATEESLTGIQKKLDDNSVMFANEKEKLLGEIKAIKTEVQPHLNELTSKLTALTQKHDAAKTELLGKLKEQQALNQTQFEKLNAENKARGKQYEKDTAQLRRDLDVTRALADRMEGEAIQTQNAFQKQEQRHKEQEKYNKARFKVLFDYQTNVNRQIKIQEKKTTNFAQLKRIRVMPDKAIALKNFRRGRYALLEEFV